ncbi:hypothetical protein QJS83_07390 [Bdellovibrio sp. 22V]|uniref:hypothetical protein n=1 Tax=Bdellovibrio TaxID=958 RepID=UPI002542A0F0|nr:hypothetical protein [Bdellovibrio sp. 22V]WII73697.1 hypothetical protein QJS83_07390 [Bdellovibrio sp. 22V]
MNKASIKFFTLALIGLTLTQAYQNCGQMGGFQTLDSSSMNLQLGSAGGTDLTHPGQKEVTPPTQKVQVVNREYVASLMREIFTTSAGPVPNLEGLLNQWIITRGAQYGLACNPYSSYTGRDCGGDIANANLAYETDDNTVRESFRIQFCENVLGMDEGVNAILEKIANRPVAPNISAIKQVYGLFYRGDEAPQLVIDSLMDLDRTLVKQNETTLERWRALALQVCESPGWQLQ